MVFPAQLYVTAKSQGPANPCLGFLNSYEPGKSSFEKKKATQESWAYYGYDMDAKLVLQGLMYVLSYNKWGPVDKTKPYYGSPEYCTKIPDFKPIEFQPAIWKNTPLSGFKIQKSVTRYSTSNKLWRVLDPRGVEFEISTSVLEQIIEDATILKGGIIDAKCAWMGNGKLVVVN